MSARLFVAVEVGEEDRRALAAWARDAVGADPALRLVGEASLHLTLAFLGHRPEEEIAGLSEVVAAFDGRPEPELWTAGALWLAPRRPHVLTVGVEDRGGALARVYDELWTALEALGPHEREQRGLRPHVTVARVRRGAHVRPRDLPALDPRRLRAPALTLFRSRLGGGAPARYEALVQAPFLR